MQEGKDKKISSVKGRIMQLLDSKGVVVSKFFPSIGLSYANFKGIQLLSSPNADVLAKIKSKFPDANLEWLLTGSGEMLCHQEPAQEHSEVHSDECNPLADLVRELTAKIEVLAKENGELRGRVNMLEQERERLFVHSGGGKLPSPTPPAAPSAVVQPEASSQPTSSPQSGSPRPITRCDASKRARK